MKKIFFLLLCVIIFGCGAKLQKERATTQEPNNENAITFVDSEVDPGIAPIPMSETENYEGRVSLKRIFNLSITHPYAYKINTRQYVYFSQTEKIQLDVINVDAPTSEPENYTLEQWRNGKWVSFPFIDNLVSARAGRELAKGDTLPEIIYMSAFKNPLRANKYKIHFKVFANLYADCILTSDSILPVRGSGEKGAFRFQVLKSTSDSIRVAFENHTSLRVQPYFFPSVGTDSLYSAHPLARSGWTGEAEWMKAHASLKGGEGLIFSIPTSWDIKRLSKALEADRFRTGKLAPGKYKLGLQIDTFMTTEFVVK